MSTSIELISDGDGLAVIGDPAAIERFLAAEDLPSKDLGLPRLGHLVGGSAAGLRAGAELAATSGRWVKLTTESAAKVKKYGLTPTKTPGVSHAMLGPSGDIKGWIQIAKGPGRLAANPAVLAGGAGLMAQLAMQQAMGEITEYLARIDEKVDDVLRSQKDSMLASMIGVGLQIEEAMTLRDHVGRVNDVMWSKVQATSGTIGETQAYALLQLDALARKLEEKTGVGDLARATNQAAPQVREWLAVLARCFQLLDAIAVLELDRVLETQPEDLDGYRRGLQAARLERLDAISHSTDRLLSRLGAAASRANEKVLLHPKASPKVVIAAEHSARALADFRVIVGADVEHDPLAARHWRAAAFEVGDKVRASGEERLDGAKRLAQRARGRARSVAERGSAGVAEPSRQWRSRGNQQDSRDRLGPSGPGDPR